MFNYLLSVAVAFIFYGTILNIVRKVEPSWYSKKEFGGNGGWIVVTICSFAWFFSVPILLTILILFVLKLLTDKISDSTLSFLNKRKLKKQSKQEI